MLVLGFASAAHADIASDIRADLQHPASAVPSVQVSVGAPVGQETLMEGSTFAHVTFTAPEGNPLSGLIDWPTNRQYTTLAAQAPIWELAAVEAAKHALAGAGGALHGISLTQNVAGRPAPPGPDVSVALTGREIPAQPPGNDVNRPGAVERQERLATMGIESEP